MKRKSLLQCFVGLAVLLSTGCTTMDFIMPEGPQGPQGEQGVPGENGASAYEIWVQQVLAGNIDWPKTEISMQDFFLFLKGADGEAGVTPHVGTNGNWWIGNTDTGVKAVATDGKDGSTPYVGTNGNWWIDGKDTGVKATGADGKDGNTPYIGENGNWWIGDTDTGVKAAGVNGNSPYIGSNGNWWIDDKDTGVKATGNDGKNGDTPYIGENGNWWIGDTDTGVKAAGDKGQNGASAYELWKAAVENGEITDPQTGEPWDTTRTSEADFYAYMAGGRGDNGLSAYEVWKHDLAQRAGTDDPMIDPKTGEEWDADRDTLEDFYEFIRGKDGQDGEDGKDGKDGKPGEVGQPGTEVVIVSGVPNVVAQFSQSEFGEYVRTTDGGVLYYVYDEEGNLAPGAVVSGLPGIDDKTYTADEEGSFIVPREDLPSIQDLNARWGTTRSVSIDGRDGVQSARNTYVPNRVDVRIRVTSMRYTYNAYFGINYVVERRLNPEDEWSQLPTYLPNASGLRVELPETSGKTDITPKSEKVIVYTNNSSESSGIYSYYVNARYKIKSNILGQKNSYSDYASGDTYFTMVGTKEYYGIVPIWNGTALLPVGQMGPIVKSISLKTFRSGTDASFASMTGTFSFDHIDYTKILKSVQLSEQDNGMQYISPEYYSVADAKARKESYVSLSYTSSSGSQKTDSSNNKSSYDSPTFTVLSPFLNSSISTNTGDGMLTYTVGKIERVGTSGNNFTITTSVSGHPTISVSYSN